MPAYDKDAATFARRERRRALRLLSSVHLCPQCDKFHVKSEFPDLPVRESARKKCLEILSLIAQGLLNKELAPIVGISAPMAEHYTQLMMRRLGAGSRAELVVIALCCGILDPRSYVPELTQRHG